MAKTITAVNVVTDTAQTKFGATSARMGHSGDNWLSTPDHADFDFGSGDFTIDFWARTPNTASNGIFFNQLGASSRAIKAQWLPSTPRIQFSYSTDGTNDTDVNFDGGAFSADTWYHIAVVKSSTTGLRIYLNGTSVATNTGSDTLGDAKVYTTGFDLYRSLAHNTAIPPPYCRGATCRNDKNSHPV